MIYDQRPDICRVDKQYQMNYQQIMSWKEFSDLNSIFCKKLQEIEFLNGAKTK